MQNIIEQFSPEFKVILECTKYYLGIVKIDDIEKKSTHVKDWDMFLKQVEHHRVVFIINHCLKQSDNLFPDDVKERINRLHKRNIAFMMKLTQELFSVSKLLQDQGINVISLKGPLLAKELYGDYFGTRKSRDLDILIDKKDIRKVDKILREKGCHIEESSHDIEYMNEKQLNSFQNNVIHHISYIHKSKKVVIEVHWRLSKNNDKNFTADIEKYGFRNVFILSDIDQLSYLANHGAVHQWFRIFWLIDIAQLIKKHNISIFWQKAVNRAKINDTDRAILSASQLVNLFFGIKIPAEMNYKIKAVDKVNREILCLLKDFSKIENYGLISKDLSSQFRTYFQKKRSSMRIKSKLRNKLIVIFNGVYSAPDWEYLKLPKQLFFLYIPLRPFIFTYKWYDRIKNKKYSFKL